MSKRQSHKHCANVVREEMAKLGCEITISTAAPLVLNPYAQALKCPHGTTFYFEPTGDQIAAWARKGIR